MPQGLQVWDENGVLVFDSSYLLGRAIEVFTPGTTDGNKQYTVQNEIYAAGTVPLNIPYNNSIRDRQVFGETVWVTSPKRVNWENLGAQSRIITLGA